MTHLINTERGSTSGEPSDRNPSVFALFLIAPLLAAIFGTATNCVNGYIDAEYYAIVLQCSLREVPAMLIAHGVVEGAIDGFVFAIVFTISSAVSTGLRYPFRSLLNILLACLGFVLAGWFVGGLSGVVWSLLSPRTFGAIFAPSSLAASPIGFAWVGGSIWGEEIVAVVCAIVVPIYLRNRWRSMHARGGFTVTHLRDS